MRCRATSKARAEGRAYRPYRRLAARVGCSISLAETVRNDLLSLVGAEAHIDLEFCSEAPKEDRDRQRERQRYTSMLEVLGGPTAMRISRRPTRSKRFS